MAEPEPNSEGSETRRWRITTAVVLLVPLAAWVAYDVYVYAVHGWRATISTVVGGWLAWSYWIALAFGLLSGHLIGSAPDGQTGAQAFSRWAVYALGIAVGFACTKMR